MRAILVVIASVIGATTLGAQSTPSTTARSNKRFQFCEADVPRFDPTNRSVDAAHPRYFVEVFEVSRRGHARTILASRPERGEGSDAGEARSRLVCERVNYPVNRDGKIVIRINRDFLRDAEFEGNFSISARIEGQGTSRAIEVPGYSMIGEEAEVAPVGVAAASTMDGMLSELDNHWIAVQARLNAIRQRADSIVLGDGAARAQRMTANLSTIRAIEDQLRRQKLQHDSLQGAVAADTTRADLLAIRTQIATIVSDVNTLSDTLQRLRNRLQRDSLSLRVASRPTFVREALATFRAQKSVQLVLQEFSRPENAPLVLAAARAQRRLPAVLINLAAQADSLWTFLVALPPTDTLPPNQQLALDEVIDGLGTIMSNLTAPTPSSIPRERQIRQILLTAVKDAEINIRQTGAQVGDVLVITFTDSVGTPRSNRSAEVRLQVREFGLVRRVSDAILLLNLPGQSNEAELRTAALSSNAAKSLDLPVATRGSPTAGVSYGWVYSPRRDDEYSPLAYPIRVVGSWLEPGFGLVATAASVPMKRITFAPDAQPTEEAAGTEIAYTLGGFTSVFDGALVFSAGWTLNGTRARAYTGIGVSFLSATEKAKELFNGLNP